MKAQSECSRVVWGLLITREEKIAYDVYIN